MISIIHDQVMISSLSYEAWYKKDSIYDFQVDSEPVNHYNTR